MATKKPTPGEKTKGFVGGVLEDASDMAKTYGLERAGSLVEAFRTLPTNGTYRRFAALKDPNVVYGMTEAALIARGNVATQNLTQNAKAKPANRAEAMIAGARMFGTEEDELAQSIEQSGGDVTQVLGDERRAQTNITGTIIRAKVAEGAPSLDKLLTPEAKKELGFKPEVTGRMYLGGEAAGLYQGMQGNTRRPVKLYRTP